MAISEEQRTQIQKLATELWSMFVEYYDTEQKQGVEVPHKKDAVTDFLRRSSPNLAVWSFFGLCSELFRDAKNSSERAGRIILDNSMAQVQGQLDGVPVSWLCDTPDAAGKECPSIVLNRAHLVEVKPLSDLVRIQNHLILHECGHLVRHWDQLRGLDADGLHMCFAKNASGVQEAEAWSFCYAVLTRVVEAYAERVKGPENTIHDATYDVI